MIRTASGGQEKDLGVKKVRQDLIMRGVCPWNRRWEGESGQMATGKKTLSSAPAPVEIVRARSKCNQSKGA